MVNPKVTPHQLDLWSGNMSYLYNSLEGEIVRIMIKRLKRGSDDITMWQAQKLQELRLFNKEVTKLLSQTTGIAEKQIRTMFQDAGKAMIDDVDGYMPYDKKPMPNNLDEVMRGYHNQSWSEIDNYVNQTLITTAYGVGTAQRAFTDTLNRTSAMFNSGLYTFEDSLERAITELAQKGIGSGMVDRGGHRWSLEGYTRTVLKSTLNNAYDEVRKDRMAEYDVHTVVVTSHAGARKACSIIQGEVVDLRPVEDIPAESEYLSIYDDYWEAHYGSPGGHRGVNCRHMHIPFIPGVNTNNQPQFDKELNDQVAKARDTQRRIEREIVKYKKNLMVAEELGSDKAAHWKRMVSKRQKAMRDHLSANDINKSYLSRNYKREKVYTPLDTVMNDFKERGHASYLSKTDLRNSTEQYGRYKSVLGSENTPQSLDKFLDLKYNNSSKYDELKTLYRDVNWQIKAQGNIKSGNVHKVEYNGLANSVFDNYKNGKIESRRYYGVTGKPRLDIDFSNHGNAKRHPVVPHAHSWVNKSEVTDDVKREGKWRSLTEAELIANKDIIGKEE